MLPVILHSCALVTSLFVQSIASPLAGAWLYFFLAGCFVIYEKAKPDGLVWYATLVWLAALGAACFLIAPTPGGSAYVWILAAAPMLALCIRKEHFTKYCIAFGLIISVYAAGIIAQWAAGVHYSIYDTADGYAWPLIDPNNAACIINMALIPAIWMALKRPVYIPLSLMLSFALILTNSKAGMFCALGAAGILFADKYGAKIILLGIISAAATLVAACFYAPDSVLMLKYAVTARLPIWEQSALLTGIKPYSGLGLGTFYYYYAQVRTEWYTAGWFAHNDLIQFVIEMGYPVTATFVFLGLSVLITTSRKNLVSALVMLVVFLQAMVEFQFYMAPVSILLGLALSYHIYERERLCIR